MGITREDIERVKSKRVSGDLVIKWEDVSLDGVPITGLGKFSSGDESTTVWFVCSNFEVGNRDVSGLVYVLYILTELSFLDVLEEHSNFQKHVGDLKDYGRSGPPSYVDVTCRYTQTKRLMNTIDIKSDFGAITYDQIINPTPTSSLTRD